MDVFEKHQVNIAKSTLRLSDAGARILGGMTKEEARAVLAKARWSPKRIKRYEDA